MKPKDSVETTTQEKPVEETHPKETEDSLSVPPAQEDKESVGENKATQQNIETKNCKDDESKDVKPKCFESINEESKKDHKLKERLSQCWASVKKFGVMLGVTWFLLPMVVLCVLFTTPLGINIMPKPPINYHNCVESIIGLIPYPHIIFIPLLIFVFLWVKRVQRKFNIYLSCAYITLIVFICKAFKVRENSCDLALLEWSLLVFLVALFLNELYRIIRTICVYNKKAKCDDEVSKGFCLQTDEKNLTDLGWGNYAKVLKQRMLATKLDRENFAIGVVGSWGSGKSTFMETLKKEFVNNFIIVNFIPWYSSSPETLIRNFFDCLRSRLCENCVDVEFSQYVELLQNIDSSGIIRMLGQLAVGNNSLEHEKKKIESKLSIIRRKVVIFIDDTDRMKGEELIEMLKIIRLSANFKNVFFVVAYDKSYMLEQMKAIGIDNGAGYLKKIFPLEIHLPFVEKDVLPDMLKEEMTLAGFDKNDVDEIAKQIKFRRNNDVNFLISKYIKNFRDVKNFVNTLTLGYDLLKRMEDKFSYKDFFWIEVIRMYLPNLYNILSDEPLSILDNDKRFSNGGMMYVYRYFSKPIGSATNDEREKEGLKEKLIGDYGYEIESILSKLFGEINKDENSIRRKNNYYKFFEYRMPTNVISNQRFRHLLDTQDVSVIRSNIQQIYNEKKIESFYSHLVHFDLKEAKNKTLAKNFIVATMEICDYHCPEELSKLVRNSVKDDVLNNVDVDSGYVFDLIQRKVSENQQRAAYKLWNKLLASIYSYEYDDGDSYKKYNSVLTDDTIKCLINLNFKNYLNSLDSPPPISEITKRGSELNTLVRDACVTYEDHGGTYTSLKLNLIYPTLLGRYSAYPESNNEEEFFAPFENCEDPEELTKELFGSKDVYNEFVEKCFYRDKKQVSTKDIVKNFNSYGYADT